MPDPAVEGPGSTPVGAPVLTSAAPPDLPRESPRIHGRSLTVGTVLGLTDPDEVARWMEQSDQIREALHARGVTNVGRYIRRRLNKIEPTEGDLRAYYREHRSVFGQRSFEDSRNAPKRLVAIRLLREELGIPEPAVLGAPATR